MYLKNQPLKIYINIITVAVTIKWLIKPIITLLLTNKHIFHNNADFQHYGMENEAYNIAVLIETLCSDLSTAWLYNIL
jgi:hypothetical protein